VHRPPPASQHTAHTACTKAAVQLSANVSHPTSHPMISPRKGASFETSRRCSLDQACETGLSQVSPQRLLQSYISCCFVLSLDTVACLTYLAFTGLTERQQLALAMEESKKAAAALQAKDRQASRQMDSEVSLCAC